MGRVWALCVVISQPFAGYLPWPLNLSQRHADRRIRILKTATGARSCGQLPSALAIHADLDLCVAQNVDPVSAGKLVALFPCLAGLCAA